MSAGQELRALEREKRGRGMEGEEEKGERREGRERESKREGESERKSEREKVRQVDP